MKVVAIVQARLGSTRLPGKMLLPLAGKSVLWHVLDRVKRAKLVDEVVLTYPVTDSKAFATIMNACAVKPCPWSGDESDLVGRYSLAADWYEAAIIVRVPGDNPCVDPAYIDEAVRSYRLFPSIYYSNTTAAVERGPVEGACSPLVTVDGIGCEVFSLSRLQWLDAHTHAYPTKGCREHPHRRFQNATVGGFVLPTADLRLDLNTPADYAFLSDLFAHVYPTHPQFTTADVLAYLKTKEVWANG